METRVLVEKSEHFERYYAQVKQRFIFWEHWQFVDMENGLKQTKAIISALDCGYKKSTKEYAEHICEFIQQYTTDAQKKALKEKEHKKFKVQYSYKHPEDQV